MKNILHELRRRNRILYFFGWFNLLAGLICVILTQSDNTMVLGISAWIKPMKFFFSIAIYSWTMNWFLYYLEKQNKVRKFTWMVVIVMLYEVAVISWQAANGRLSHFNNTRPFYAILFALMGIAITILTTWTGYMGYLFFRQKQFNIPMIYVWGIRIGIIIFVIFSFEGGIMAQRLAHTVGAADGSEGLPLVNWSKRYGDLRVAHFFGMHALQIIPWFSYFIAKTKTQLVVFSLCYGALVVFLLARALSGLPIF